MTTPTKTWSSIFSGTVLASGAPNTSSSWINLSSGFASSINIRITNGVTGPTVPAQVQIYVGNNYASGGPVLPTAFGGPIQGTSTNNDVTYASVVIDIPYQSAQLVAGSNTGQAVTLDADISVVNPIS